MGVSISGSSLNADINDINDVLRLIEISKRFAINKSVGLYRRLLYMYGVCNVDGMWDIYV